MSSKVPMSKTSKGISRTSSWFGARKPTAAAIPPTTKTKVAMMVGIGEPEIATDRSAC
jgi:hypothetical protein